MVTVDKSKLTPNCEYNIQVEYTMDSFKRQDLMTTHLLVHIQALYTSIHVLDPSSSETSILFK